MNWKFWQKKDDDALTGGSKKEAKPRDLPQVIGQNLVVERGLDPDWVWTLKIVTREREKGIFDFRLFDPAMAGLKVTGFSALDDRSDLILFDGWYEKNGTAKQINDKNKQTLGSTAA